jgi:pimeloyl-ACP methyl ester carboxylesterase
MSPFSTALLLSMLLTLAGCAFSPPYVAEPQPLEPGRLPPPNTALNVPQLGPCTDSPDRTLHLNASHPVTVLVHGCNGSAGRFRSLAQLYAFHGQQAVCFNYDDRDSLVRSSGQLITALDELARHLPKQDITVMGHSMGGLVARKAMERDRSDAWRRHDANISLATVSAPLAGIRAAEQCGYKALHWLSLGVVPAACWLVTGDNWSEINASSDFIQRPGPLLPSVRRYLKVVTDERDTCRRRSSNGTCIESDYIFSQAEQYHPVIDGYAQLVNVEVQAGHVEIVGDKEIVPRKLLGILQQQGLLASTPPERLASFEKLLAQVYGP